MGALLEVVVSEVDDARRAEAGGADRLMLVGEHSGQGISPTPQLVAQVLDNCTIPVRPLLRLREGYRTDGGEFTRLQGLMANYLDDGADGVVLGFLDGYARVDVEVVNALVADQPVRWTFDHGIDRCLDTDEAWHTLLQFAGLDAVLTAGSVRGLDSGLDDLISRARSHREQAALMMAGGGLAPEHVPWLSRAGVRAYQVGQQVRAGGDVASPVDTRLVQSWRILLDRH